MEPENVPSEEEEFGSDIEEEELILSDREEEEEEEESEPESDWGISDSCYESDNDIDTDVSRRLVTRAEVNTLDGTNRVCAIYFYYTPTNNNSTEKICGQCIVRVNDLFSRLYAVREHTTARHWDIRGMFCTECRGDLHKTYPCNQCPICTSKKKSKHVIVQKKKTILVKKHGSNGARFDRASYPA
ncbi:hypothetical protein ALC62_16009 [Cyphomyrmex costatus]|uniref:Uncharacterized protein n=2 Tax=Cyphomyrmex costatus TaxID=456900 RepID=A0A151I698_9HYME|nr:hypothetical protein ALC62_16009 [Cyphomyrmex costatus]